MAAKRSLLDMALENVPPPRSARVSDYPGPREFLVQCGHSEDYVEELDNDALWALYTEEFGGILYTTMREINEYDESATMEWFRERKFDRYRGFKLLKSIKAAAAKLAKTETTTPADAGRPMSTGTAVKGPTTPAKPGMVPASPADVLVKPDPDAAIPDAIGDKATNVPADVGAGADNADAGKPPKRPRK